MQVYAACMSPALNGSSASKCDNVVKTRNEIIFDFHCQTSCPHCCIHPEKIHFQNAPRPPLNRFQIFFLHSEDNKAVVLMHAASPHSSVVLV